MAGVLRISKCSHCGGWGAVLTCGRCRKVSRHPEIAGAWEEAIDLRCDGDDFVVGEEVECHHCGWEGEVGERHGDSYSKPYAVFDVGGPDEID